MNHNKEKREPRKPVQQRGINTAQKIIEAGRRCFESQGYHGCNSKDIAKEAGVGIGTLYGYFKDKKEIFIEVINLFYDEIAEKALTIEEKDLALLGKPKNLVSMMIDRLLAAHTIAPDLHREITAVNYSDPEIHKLIESKDKDILLKLKALLTTVEDKIKVKDLEAASYVIFRTSEEIIHNLKMFDSPLEEDRVLSETKNMIFKYLFL